MTGLEVKDIVKTFRVELPRQDTFSSITRFLSGRSPTRAFTALNGISFSLKPGRALAVCGPNGAGKTTLLKVLAGITTPDRGSVSFRGKTACLLGFASIMQERLSVRDNAYLCSVFFEIPGDPDSSAEKIISAAGLEQFRNARAGELSAGMKLRLPFMAALSSGAQLFLIDETLAVGDAAFKEKCLTGLKLLKEQGAMMVFATHDPSLAHTLGDDGLFLDAGNIVFLGQVGKIAEAEKRTPGTAFRDGLDRHILLYEKLRGDGFSLKEGPAASDEELLLVHTPSWLSRLKANDLTPDEEEDLALPYSRHILPLSWRMAGGTVTAARAAAAGGTLGVFPPGGGHHAFPDRGEGFCPVNDIAVAARVLLREGTAKRPAVIDLDAHQGNGTAFIFADGEVRTFSAHRVEGYPRNRVRSTMDADIPLGASDEAYLPAVKRGILDFLGMARPDFVFALCSADAYKEDTLGGLKVTMEGLRERDEFLFRTLAERKIPVCLVLGGAYSTPEEAAGINFSTIKAAAAAYPDFGGEIVI